MVEKMKNKTKIHVLFLEKDNPKREQEFEIKFMISLTVGQRYKMMSRLVRAGLRIKGKNDHKKTPVVITRT